MSLSKALKPTTFSRYKKSTSTNKYIIALVSFKNAVLLKTYWPIVDFKNLIIERSKRVFDYALFSWTNYDFDSKSVYGLMAFKYKRLYETLKDGHAIQEKEDLDALKETIKICTRLYEEKYADKYYRIHDKKWGTLKTKDVLITEGPGKGNYLWTSSRKKAKTESQKLKERQETRDIYKFAEADRVKDIERFAELLIKHESSWWD